jgi:methionyl-tRNA formyltransferase
MGTPEFAVPSLDILLADGYDVAAVVTAPDKPRGRGQALAPTAVKQCARGHGLTVLQPVVLNDPSFAEALRGAAPDLIVVVAFRILPKSIFTIPRLGSFNLHASLLPRYRGAAPITWAIMNGERETGVTTFFLDEKVDTGGILLQARIPIRPDDDAGTVHDRLAEVGAEIVLHTVRLIEQGKAHPQPQDNALASPAPKIFRENCRIAWDRQAQRIHDFVRGLSPSPAAYTLLNGAVFKIFRTAITDEPARGAPGQIAATRDTIRVACADRMLSILELQHEGRKRMEAAAFLRGTALKADSRFE